MSAAIDLYCAMREGDKFTLRGRTLTVRNGGPGGCFSAYSEHAAGGERWEVPVWNDKGKATLVTLRPSTTIVVGEHAHQHGGSLGDDHPACSVCPLCGRVEHYGCPADPYAAERAR